MAGEVLLRSDRIRAARAIEPFTSSPKRGKARLLLVDDHPIVRLALSIIFRREKDLEVCGEAGDSKGALKAVASCKPDLAIVGNISKDSEGLQLVKGIKAQHPGTLTLVLSEHAEPLQAARAARAGAKGYLCKQEPSEKLLSAVREILSAANGGSPVTERPVVPR